jgi:hypothetical protein
MCVTNRNELCLDAFYFIFIITVLLAGKPRFKGRLEGVRNWSMPQIIWVQVGPQARIRDLKFFFGDPSSCPS